MSPQQAVVLFSDPTEACGQQLERTLQEAVVIFAGPKEKKPPSHSETGCYYVTSFKNQLSTKAEKGKERKSCHTQFKLAVKKSVQKSVHLPTCTLYDKECMERTRSLVGNGQHVFRVF